MSSFVCHACRHQKVRPVDYLKWVTKFNGLGDVHVHLASFRQVSRAKKVTNLYTLVEGFGMMLEERALALFQMLQPSNYQSLKALEKDFIAAFSKIGHKHNGLSLLYGFKKESIESLRDYALQSR